ncbi:MAG: 3-phosphoshikimate 1-carboxyvinyltransferase [Planctomycetota bacterium]
MPGEFVVKQAVPNGKIIQIPGSKSITLRAVTAAALARGKSRIAGALDCDDSRNLIGVLRSLGVEIEVSQNGTELQVVGTGGEWPEKTAKLSLGDCGTGYRFVAALACLGEGPYVLRGSERLEQRPMGPLVGALRILGADIEQPAGGDGGPITVRGGNVSGKRVSIHGDVSSQFISALLLIGPCLAGGIEVAIEGALVSRPYIDVTLGVMKAFGAEVRKTEPGGFFVDETAEYAPCDYSVEPDASSACYWFAAAAITGGSVTVPGIPPDSVQADLKLLDVLADMGCEVEGTAEGITVRGGKLRGVRADLSDFPDAAPALAVIAAFADGPTEIVNVGGLRHKESDRIAAIVEELRRAGIEVREFEDAMTIVPSAPKPAVFETHNDHRIAMSMALMGLVVPGVKVKNPEVVSKSYPGFWDDLNSLAI